MTVKAFTVVPTGSGVLRAVSERDVLDLFNARLAAISLSGFIFFGSSVKISDQVRSGAPLSECTVQLSSHCIGRFHRAIFFSNVARRTACENATGRCKRDLPTAGSAFSNSEGRCTAACAGTYEVLRSG